MHVYSGQLIKYFMFLLSLSPSPSFSLAFSFLLLSLLSQITTDKIFDWSRVQSFFNARLSCYLFAKTRRKREIEREKERQQKMIPLAERRVFVISLGRMSQGQRNGLFTALRRRSNHVQWSGGTWDETLMGLVKLNKLLIAYLAGASAVISMWRGACDFSVRWALLTVTLIHLLLVRFTFIGGSSRGLSLWRGQRGMHLVYVFTRASE